MRNSNNITLISSKPLIRFKRKLFKFLPKLFKFVCKFVKYSYLLYFLLSSLQQFAVYFT